MEWQNFQQEGGGEGESGSGLCVKVMTDEQLDLLRKQIAVYASICELLVQKHKICSAQHEFTGMKIGNPYYDPFVASGGLKITARQRWTPTSVQLQILERVYEECKGTPSKQKIQETASELTKHGQISETNVYNWFQNRRARLKRKQSGSAPNNAEPEAEPTVETGKKNLESFQSFENSAPGAENIYLPSPEIGIEQMINKMEIPGSLSFHWQMDRYHDLLG